MAAGITMKIAYGHKVESANDEFVAIGDKGVATIDAAGTVGAHIVDFIPWRSLHDIRDKVDLIWNSSKEVYTQKKAALLAGDEAVSQQISQGKDIMSLLSAYY